MFSIQNTTDDNEFALNSVLDEIFTVRDHTSRIQRLAQLHASVMRSDGISSNADLVHMKRSLSGIDNNDMILKALSTNALGVAYQQRGESAVDQQDIKASSILYQQVIRMDSIIHKNKTLNTSSILLLVLLSKCIQLAMLNQLQLFMVDDGLHLFNPHKLALMEQRMRKFELKIADL